MEYPNVKEYFEDYIAECQAYHTAYDHWLAGKVLTADEAKILGIGHPFKKLFQSPKK